MPVNPDSSYQAPWFLRNGHVQTIYPILFRPRPVIDYERERLDTEDGDFLDLDWARVGSKHLTIVCHGLEGCSIGIHALCMVEALNAGGHDALVLNFRACADAGRIPNRTKRFYHSGETGDLRAVIAHAGQQYDTITLTGFSLGGNVILVYLGKHPETVHSSVKRAAVFSVPCDLASSSRRLASFANRLYMRRFLKSLATKLRAKEALLPGQFDLEGLDDIRTFQEFDDRYTAPIHGFDNAEHYWAECSSTPYLKQIRIPTLLVNALDDPFLTKECFPYAEAAALRHVHLETPGNGGHNGFILLNQENRSWTEKRALQFLQTDGTSGKC